MSSVLTGLATALRGMRWGSQLISAGVLLALMFLVTFDVSGRFFFAMPIRGTYELSKFMLVAVVAFGLAYTQAVKGHINADVVISRLSHRKQSALEALYSLIGIIFFVLIVIQSSADAIYDLRTDLVSDILGIPAFPFKLLIPVGGSLMVLELLVDLVRHIRQLGRGG